MDQHTPTFARIDVSKATLDAYLHPEGSHRQFKNHKTGWRALRGWLNAAHPDGVVYEATGARPISPLTKSALDEGAIV